MIKYETTFFDQNLSQKKLAQENRVFKNTGGVSQENRSLGFSPAFFDSESRKIYLSRNKDGSRAAIHMLDGLPEELIIEKDSEDHIISIKSSVISGFVMNDQFYTREQAASVLH